MRFAGGLPELITQMMAHLTGIGTRKDNAAAQRSRKEAKKQRSKEEQPRDLPSDYEGEHSEKKIQEKARI
jgi:hypothetical protein